jgi:Dolichyl-phosphate-mannose-protein mannosyltransferase
VDRRRGLDVVLALGLAGGAAWRRAGPLAPSSLWSDDAWVALAHRVHGARPLVRVGATAPGFSLLERAWTGVVGFSELRAQLLPFLAGAAGPAVVYWAGLRLGLRRWAALLAGLLLLASRLDMTYSTRVKQYTLDVLGAALVLALGWSVASNPADRWRWWLLSAVASAFTLLSAAAAPVAAAAFLVALLASVRRSRRLPTTSTHRTPGLGVVSGAVAVWLASLAVVLAVTRGATANPALANSVAYGFLFRHGHGLSIVRAVLANLTPLPFGMAAGLLVACGAVTWWRQPRLALLLTTPLALAVALSAAGQAPLAGRFEAYLYPSLVLLVGAGLSSAAALGLARAAPAVALAVAATVLARLPNPLPYPAEGVRPLAGRLAASAGQGDAVLLPFSTSYAAALYLPWPVAVTASHHYLTGFRAAPRHPAVIVVDPRYDVGWRAAAAGRLDPLPWPPAEQRAAVARAAGHRRVWLLGSAADADLEALLRAAGYHLAERDRSGYSSLSRWDR